MQISAPSSGEFRKFIDFAKLLTDPKKLKESLGQFEKVIKECDEALAEHSKVLKIAGTLEKVVAMEEEAEVELSRIKSQNMDLDARLASVDADIEAKKKKFTSDAEKVKSDLDEREAILTDAETKFNAKTVTQEAAFQKREDALNEGEARLEREFGAIKEKKARVDEAYAG